MKLTKTLHKQKRIWIRLTLGIFLFGIMTISFLMESDDLRLRFGKIYEMNEDWEVEFPKGSIQKVNLPDLVDVEPGEVLKMSKELPADFRYGKVIRIRSSMQNIQVKLNDKSIYDNTINKRKTIPYTPEASAWIFVDIPENNENSILELRISTDISVMSGRLNEIYYGSEGDLIGELITRNSVDIFVAIFIFSVAIFSLIAGISVKLRTIERLNYISVFAFAVGIWLVSEMDILQLFFSNNYIIGSCSYFMLPIGTISFILFMKDVVLSKYSKILNNFTGLVGIFLPVAILIQLIWGIDYIQTWPIFIVLLVIIVLTIIGFLILEISHKSIGAKKYLLYISVLVVTVLIETTMFLIGDFMNVSSFSSIGVLFFLVLLIVDTMNYIGQVVQKDAESKYLRDIAYKDSLTKGLNRAAFEKDIDEILTSTEKEPFRLSMFDLNGLKEINDVYGHEYGDQALIEFHTALLNVFSQNGSCYRIGGDEFMVIQKNTSEADFKLAIKYLKTKLKKMEEVRDFIFEAAYGSDIYQFEESFGEFKHHVDLKMYQEKRRQKDSKRI